ncbi:glycosyltransferase family 4 protein [Sinorhizobium numidicum]|uniref:Glycosyltransferase family 4 protein n=1 Tax=Sinorhizobium numidicum TaxID=680248 RepID=A0ABY8D2I4_9HYPH|nr:glycosyltransferase family 4 protein [Sinorhizobium numidicum]WEX79075.1 glycosyltransferase family 4 protein [Sinorhizobium numidicum]WEX85100.1 glycosyltransferase family 4 protein [Sinorhizobium numidicum]
MSVDAIGGVWRYAMDLAGAVRTAGVETVFVGFGPAPSEQQRREAERIGMLEWTNAPLDWTVADEEELDIVPDRLAELSIKHSAELLQLNLPSQAASCGNGLPVVAVSHSCVVTWFEAVRASALPPEWLWQKRRNRQGLDRADVVLAPSRSHAAALARCYGPIGNLSVVYNASRQSGYVEARENFVFAAGRWWDEGKNGAVLDRAAAAIHWPVVIAGSCDGPSGQRLTIEHADHRGELAHDDTMALMSRAAIVVSPSIYEPFGLAALEAARSGTALVLADIPTYRELWDGAALFADPADPGALAAAVNRLVDDARLRAELGRRARLRSRRFTIEAQRNAMLDVYRQAVREPRRMTAAE